MQLISRFRGLLRWGLILGAGVLALLCTGVEPAAAYPQFQFTTYSSHCNMCHYSPTGGGLINGFGRDESADTISSMGGNGGFLHGLWQPPSWLALGVDMRAAGLVKQNSEVPQLLAFPMQGDIYARVALGSKLSVNATAGIRGAARAPRTSPLDRMISREHYLMWQQGTIYARAGRFMVPYGLRTQDHSSYTRRYLGQHTLEETYNLSVGRVANDWEAHATAFVSPPFWGVGPQAMGGALYYERRIREETGAYGVQSRVAMTDEDARYWLGGVGKLWLEEKKTLLLSQLDLGMQTFAGGADAIMQLSAHLSATYLWRQGWMMGAALERYDPDLLLKGSARDSLALTFQYFPRAHLELMLLGKVEFQGEAYASPNPMGLLMLHYYL